MCAFNILTTCKCRVSDLSSSAYTSTYLEQRLCECRVCEIAGLGWPFIFPMKL